MRRSWGCAGEAYSRLVCHSHDLTRAIDEMRKLPGKAMHQFNKPKYLGAAMWLHLLAGRMIGASDKVGSAADILLALSDYRSKVEQNDPLFALLSRTRAICG